MKTQFVVITGCSTGIGLGTAHYMANHGYKVIATVRKAEDFAALQHPNIQPIILDVADKLSREAGLAKIKELLAGEPLFALVNNAGVNYVSPFELTDEAQFRQMMEVNVFGLSLLTQQLFPLLVAYPEAGRGRSKIINISSIGGAIGLPWEFGYHASKFGVLGLSQSWRFEFAPLGIDVTAVMPGGIKTKIFEKSLSHAKVVDKDNSGGNKLTGYYQKNMQLYKRAADTLYKYGSEPEAVAKIIVKQLGKQKSAPRVRVGLDAKILYSMVKFLPASWFHGLMQSQMAVR